MSEQSTLDRRQVITDLEKQLKATSRASRPHEHAVLAYRLGLAHAESAGGADDLRQALAYYDVAAAIFDPRFEPVQHARVLNAAGAAHRLLGSRTKAAELFEKASSLFEGQAGDNERAAALNNLGLTRTELGRFDGAVEAFDAAVGLWDTYTPEGKRGMISTLLNRGQAHTAQRSEEGLEAALADFEEARSMMDPEENPLHHGMVEHSVGVTCTELARLKPDDRGAFLKEAVRAFDDSLTVFTRTAFPYYHALAKHNLGLAREQLGGTANLRRALVCFEDTVAVLDPRLHADAWRQGYASLERAEKALAEVAPGMTRAQHVAALLAVADPDERSDLLHERVYRLMAQPEARALSAVAELASAIASLGFDQARVVYEALVKVVVELPRDEQALGMRAVFEAHRQIADDEAREEADRSLDQAIADALQGPQRVMVRDFLESLGWERP